MLENFGLGHVYIVELWPNSTYRSTTTKFGSSWIEHSAESQWLKWLYLISGSAWSCARLLWGNEPHPLPQWPQKNKIKNWAHNKISNKWQNPTWLYLNWSPHLKRDGLGDLCPMRIYRFIFNYYYFFAFCPLI